MAEPEFRIVRSFKAPRALVWRAWADPALLARWFGPKGTRTQVLAHDLRPGGILHSRMEMPDGNGMHAKFVYREVVPPSRLAWVHSFADADANVVPAPFGPWPLEMLTTVLLEDDGDDTGLTLTWIPIDPTPEERAAFEAGLDSMRDGWGGSFDQLDAFLAEDRAGG